jgi:short-subunit dehydrogenase
MKEITGATALVTGASRGIGVHIARALAQRGANIALAARSATELEATRDAIAALGVKVVAIPTDVTVASQRGALLERAESEIGPVDILVNNAGIESASAYADFGDEEVERMVAVNLTAALLLTRAVLPGMLTRGRGHVVNIASGLGKMAIPYLSVYSATKHGLVGATQALRAEYRDTPVGFSVVCPGFIRNEGLYARHEADGAVAPRLAGRTTPEKVANAVVQAIVHDRPEVIVNSQPLRPLVLLFTLFPRLHAPMLKAVGISRWSERAAATRHDAAVEETEVRGLAAERTEAPR